MSRLLVNKIKDKISNVVNNDEVKKVVASLQEELDEMRNGITGNMERVGDKLKEISDFVMSKVNQLTENPSSFNEVKQAAKNIANDIANSEIFEVYRSLIEKASNVEEINKAIALCQEITKKGALEIKRGIQQAKDVLNEKLESIKNKN